MKEVLSGIYTWPWFSEPHGYNFNGHLVCLPSGNLCFDPVEPTAADLEEMARLGVSRIIVTNRNHSRAANKVRARTGARTAIHPADAPLARKEGAARRENHRAKLRSIGRSARFSSPAIA